MEEEKMRKSGKSTLTSVSLAAAAVIAVTAAAASATWTFLPGGHVTAVNSGNVYAKDTTTGTAATCTKVTASATAKSGSGLAPTDLVSLDSILFSSPANPKGWCSGPSGVTVGVTAQNLPWKFTAISYDATKNVVSGKMTGVIASVVGTDNCHATFSAPGGGGGEVGITYNNGNGTIATTSSNLVATSVDANCDPTLMNLGDSLAVTAQFVVTPRQTVTSP
ncbi:hypothetical protein AB0J52_04435 [Spirillospora sp. NPDC049652]